MADEEAETLAAIASGSIADILGTPLTEVEMDDLVAKSALDPGAPFDSIAVARMLATRNASLADFERLRSRLRGQGVRVSVLDKHLQRDHADDSRERGQGRPISFPDIDPWDTPVDGASLLDEIKAQVQRYVVLHEASAIAIALWAVHTYCFHVFEFSPRLAITSPEKRCGKTTLLGVVEALVSKPLSASNITAAAMFRTVEDCRPTLLIDEADTFLPDNEDLRGVLNSGHKCTGNIIRLVGDDHKPRQFSTFCPTAIAAIGSLPGTIEDRAIMVRLRRRLKHEPATPLRSNSMGHLRDLRRKIARWVDDNAGALASARPSMPTELNDRASDNWTALAAIASCAGREWLANAQAAALFLSNEAVGDDQQSRSVGLLKDILKVFDDRAVRGVARPDRISSTDMANALGLMVDRPWSTWSRGALIRPASVAKLLLPFGIRPNTIQLAGGQQPNGYKREQFDDAYNRYAAPSAPPPPPPPPAPPAPPPPPASARPPNFPNA